VVFFLALIQRGSTVHVFVIIIHTQGSTCTSQLTYLQTFLKQQYICTLKTIFRF